MTADEQQDLFVLSIFINHDKAFTYDQIKEIEKNTGTDISYCIFNLKERYLLDIGDYPMDSGYIQHRYSITSLGKLRYKNLVANKQKEIEEEIRSNKNLKFSKRASIASIVGIAVAILGIAVAILIFYLQRSK
ncbi:MAG: hypothetical protein M3Z26_08145 [Bacteroidota bacterium]|nr:hypothetical protein [Bacteroidota bacterium]